MPEIDLSTLSGPELRRLLNVARTRGNTTLEKVLMAEMGARRTRGPRRPGATASKASAEADPGLDDLAIPYAMMDLRPSRKPRRSAGMSTGFGAMAAAVVVAALAWHFWGIAPLRAVTPVQRHNPTEPSPRVMTITTAAPGVESSAPRVTADAAVQGPALKADACTAKPTPADRLVCSDQALARLDRQAQEAYARALNSRAAAEVVGEDQAEWRELRDAATDPAGLAQLYDRRIRELNAASDAAEAQRAVY